MRAAQILRDLPNGNGLPLVRHHRRPRDDLESGAAVRESRQHLFVHAIREEGILRLRRQIFEG